MKIALLLAAAMVLLLSTSLVAQDWSDPVSASIKVTATVVPTLGGSFSQEPVQFASLDDGVGLSEAYTRYRLHVQFPSLSSVIVSVESCSGARENMSLLPSHSDGIEADLTRPGAVFVDLNALLSGLNASDGECIVTLIYSEN